LVKLRLRRMGRKKMPIYKIVAADSRAPRDGRFIESVGIYNPNDNPVSIDLKEDRVFYWLKSGAQPTYTVKSLLSRKGLMLKLHLSKKGGDAQKISGEYDKWTAVQENKLKNEADKRARRKEKKKKSAEQPAVESPAVENPVVEKPAPESPAAGS
jgi:small subunit ribosomal protein S16